MHGSISFLSILIIIFGSVYLMKPNNKDVVKGRVLREKPLRVVWCKDCYRQNSSWVFFIWVRLIGKHIWEN